MLIIIEVTLDMPSKTQPKAVVKKSPRAKSQYDAPSCPARSLPAVKIGEKKGKAIYMATQFGGED